MQIHRPSTLVFSPTFAVVCLVLLSSVTVVQAQTPVAPPAAPSRVDPISAAITEASHRFGVPESWIRSVMHVESAANPIAVSHAGAMGLMQVMPGTYAELRSRYGLGADPFAIRDNILAGTAYLREMHDRYGAPGFLAAYNAGPGRWEAYVNGDRPLPGETIRYLARLAPAIGTASLPVPSSSSSPVLTLRPPSPFAAPIFVALHSATDDEISAAGAQQIRQRVAARNAVERSNGELFVSRETTIEPSIEASPETIGNATPADEPATPADPAPTSLPRTNPLFPPRSTGPGR